MILSDRDIRAAIAAGEIGIEPFDETAVQPSSVDLHVDRFFRTFHNARHPYIDVKIQMDDLTEMVEVKEDEAFILHPGEFVLGSTAEYVRLPSDLVARLEGKSSLGRLGLLIHSSLPGDETVLFLQGRELAQRRIDEIVQKRLHGSVVSFDPSTFEVGYHEVTGWQETAPDRILEVRLASGRRVCLTGGHALFTLGRDGEMVRLRVHELAAGTKVAIAGKIPDPPGVDDRLEILSFVPESAYPEIVCGGPSIQEALRDSPTQIAGALAEIGVPHHHYYRRRGCLPLSIALELPKLTLGPQDWLASRGGRHRIPAVIKIDENVAWLLGLYVAEGSRRRKQFTISNHDPAVLDRAQDILKALGLPVYRYWDAITCCSDLMSSILEWIGLGGYSAEKRIPHMSLGWSRRVLNAFLEGFVVGDGSLEETRTSLWSSSERLVGDFLMVCCRLNKRAAASRRNGRQMWQVSIPRGEHKLLTSVPLPEHLLIKAREQGGLDQKTAARLAGFRYGTQLNNLERRRWPNIRLRTLRRLRAAYRGLEKGRETEVLRRLGRIIEGDLRWDEVVEVRDTGRFEPVFDLEVRPGGRTIENFLAGTGGVFVSNTAGYVDPGFEGHLTLELSNVANLPITIYPGMKIGQISFFRLTSEAEHPYGSKAVGSKYQGQRGPTPSQYYKNFRND